MAPGPVTSAVSALAAVSTVVAPLFLYEKLPLSCGSTPTVWEKLTASSAATEWHVPALPEVTQLPDMMQLAWSAISSSSSTSSLELESSDTLASSLARLVPSLPQVTQLPDTVQFAWSAVASSGSLEPEANDNVASSLDDLVPHRPVEPSVVLSMRAVQWEASEQMANALDGWGLGPLLREQLSLLLQQCGLSGLDTMIPEVPGLVLLISAINAVVLPLLLCFKICCCCRRSQKPTAPIDKRPGSSKVVDQSKHMARLPTPSRARKPTMSPQVPQPAGECPQQECPQVPQPAEDELMDICVQQEKEWGTISPAVGKAASPSVTEDTPMKVRGRGFVHYQSPKQPAIFPRRSEKDPALNAGAVEFEPCEKVQFQYQ